MLGELLNSHSPLFHLMPVRKQTARRTRIESASIPDKLYFRIGEVSRLCALPPSVLRFWESEFPQLRPTKSDTGQRMYRRKHVECVLRIKTLLYGEGFTIAGARQQLREESKTQAVTPPLNFGAAPPPSLSPLRRELHAILGILNHKH